MTKPSGTINLWELPGMLEKAGHDPGTTRDTVRNALLNRELYAHTCILDGQYDPTGKVVVFDHTDWAGTAAWAAILTGRIPWPLNGIATGYVSVLVYEGDAKKWIKSVTGGAAKRKATSKDINACKKWLISEMRMGDKPVPRYHYEALAKDQLNLGPRPFQRAWGRAIENVCNQTWDASGPIKSGPDPQKEVPLIKERLLEFMTPVRDTNNS